MNIRIFLIALLGGIVSTVTAYYPLYRWFPGQFVTEWAPSETQLALSGLAFTLLIWLMTGAVAARMSGVHRRLAAAGIGALAGLIAAWMVEIALGGTAAGVWGARLMLAHGIHATRDEAEFAYLLSHGVSSIVWGTYLSIWAVGGSGAVLGAVGGWIAGPGGKPARSENSLWLMVSALATPVAAFSTLAMIDTYVQLGMQLKESAEKWNLQFPYSPEVITSFPVATHMIWLIFWQFFAWRMIRKSKPVASLRLLVVPLLSLLLLIALALILPLGALGLSLINNPWGTPIAWLTLLLIAGLMNWIVARARFPAKPLPPGTSNPTGLRKRLTNFLRRLGEARLGAWYFFFLNLLTFLLAFLVSGDKIKHYPWLVAGLGLGIVVGGLGIWETRITVSSDDIKMEERFEQLNFFIVSAISGFINSLWTGLVTLAPLSLTLIPTVMISPLSQHEEAAALAQATFTLTEMVDSNYRLTGILLANLLPFVLFFALLFSAVATWLKKRRNPEKASTPISGLPDPFIEYSRQDRW